MKAARIYIISLFFLFTAFNSAQPIKYKTNINSNLYFPIGNNITLVYKSSFGECITRYYEDEEYIISLSESDKFKYRQTLLIKEDGVYAKEIYQFFKIFLFIKKESTLIYGKPLLRFPIPLLPNAEWVWEGSEYSDGDTTKVKVTGKAFDKEFVTTQAGKFEAVRVESIVEGSANAKNRVSEWYAEGIGLIKAKIVIEGGGVMGFLRDILGYGIIEFELKEIKK